MGSVKKPIAINQESGKRPYVADLSYQEQMRRLAEKSLDNSMLIKQSEFKKPYQTPNYGEMEYFANVGMPPWKFTPINPDQGWKPDCKVQVEQSGAQDSGWLGCSDNCAIWIFSCAHRLKNIGCGNCEIRKITKLEGDRLAVLICSASDTLDIGLVSDYDPKGSTIKERFCVGEGHDPGCSTCEKCTQTGYPPVITYTTQQMSVNGTQNLKASGGGGGPYTWNITPAGGGSLSKTKTASGEVTIYTAPASNANCANNPTIQVIDFCLHTASLKIAVNGDGNAGPAYEITRDYIDYSGACSCGGNCTLWVCPHLTIRKSRCDGTFFSDASCTPAPTTGLYMVACPPIAGCATVGCSTCTPDTTSQNCNSTNFGVAKDDRTGAMLAAGCCPAALL